MPRSIRAARGASVLEVPLTMAVAMVTVLPVWPLQDWYVDGTAPCPGQGTPASPFCQIGLALSVAVDGDTVHVAPGSYPENLTLLEDLTLLGTAGASSTFATVFSVNGGAQVTIDGFSTTGVASTGSRLTLANCTVSNGGGVVNSMGTVTIRDSSITNNPTTGVSNFEGTMTIYNSTVSGNQSASSPAGIYNYGTYFYPSALKVYDSTISGNDSGYYGGGIFNGGTAWANSVTLENTTVSNNTAYYGGGIYNDDGLTIRDSTISGNQALYGSGGGVFTRGTTTIERSTVSANYAYYDAGGIYAGGTTTLSDTLIVDNTSVGIGGALVNDRSLVTLDGVTVSGNQGWNTGGVYSGPYTTRIGHSILAGNSGNDVRGSGVFTTAPNFIGGDPLFVNPGAGDYHLQPTSGAIDSGDPLDLPTGVDREGNCRLLDGDLDRTMIRDLGAFEFTHARLAVTGVASPGSTLTVSVQGTPGMLTFLWLGLGQTEVSYPPFGCFRVDLGAGPWLLTNLGTSPVAPLTGTIPPNTPLGTELVLQAQVLGGSGGNLTNAESRIVE